MVIFDMIYREPAGRVVHIGRWDGTTEAPPADWVGEEGPVEILPDASRRVWAPEPTIDPPTEAGFSLPDPQPDPLGEELERARRVNRELFSNVDDDLNPQAPSDWDMDGQGVVEGVVTETYVPDFTIIPDALAKFALADESAAEFRARLKGLWQRFGIEDGHHFPGGGEALTGEEKITMREIDIVLNSDEGKNASLLEWMLAGERRT